MKNSPLSRSAAMITSMCLLLTFLSLGFSHPPESGAALQKRLVGTWWSRGDLVFTITSDGGYVSSVTLPQPHALAGTAEVKNGVLIITITNRDKATVPSP